MKAIVDPNTCTGCGLCAETCPEVFEMSDDKAQVRVKTVPGELQETCREAVENCPVEAISLED